MSSNRKIFRLLNRVRALDPALRQGRMQIDHMRHHRGAKDARRQQHALGAGELRRQERAERETRVRLAEEGLDDVAATDHEHEHGDDRFEGAEAPVLQGEDAEGREAGDDRRPEQRDTEQQVEADRGPEELGQVGRHGDQLGLAPEEPDDGFGEPLADRLREVLSGRDPKLGGERLNQHRHQVGGDDDPDQEITVLGAALDVGREVAGVDIGDAGNECRPEERQDAPKWTFRAGASQDRGRCRKRSRVRGPTDLLTGVAPSLRRCGQSFSHYNSSSWVLQHVTGDATDDWPATWSACPRWRSFDGRLWSGIEGTE